MMWQNLPYQEVWIKKSFLMGPKNFKWGKDEEMVSGVLVGVKATRGEILLFEVFLPEYHASYDKVVQAAIFNKPESPDREILMQDVGWWNCLSGNIQVYNKAIYQDMKVKMYAKTGNLFEGSYKFTIDFVAPSPNEGVDITQAKWWSEHKQKNFFFDDATGALICGPNNKMRYIDESLCTAEPKKPFFKVYEPSGMSHSPKNGIFFGDSDGDFDYEAKK